MKTKNRPQVIEMTEKGTTQLSMNVDPELKTRIKITAIQKNKTMTELILSYILDGLNKDEK